MWYCTQNDLTDGQCHPSLLPPDLDSSQIHLMKHTPDQSSNAKHIPLQASTAPEESSSVKCPPEEPPASESQSDKLQPPDPYHSSSPSHQAGLQATASITESKLLVVDEAMVMAMSCVNVSDNLYHHLTSVKKNPIGQ